MGCVDAPVVPGRGGQGEGFRADTSVNTLECSGAVSFEPELTFAVLTRNWTVLTGGRKSPLTNNSLILLESPLCLLRRFLQGDQMGPN